jgi:hypothetical protein
MQQSMFEFPQKGAAATLKQADPKFLVEAVATLFFEFSNADMQPGAEKWSRCRRHRIQITEAIFTKWTALSGKDNVFPWSEDYVLLVWVAFRKQTDEVKREWKEYLS